MSSELARAHRREARVALAMLPVGSVLLVVSALAFVVVVLLALAAPLRGGAWWWTELWCLLALAIAGWNTLSGIAITAAFDWRPLPAALLRSGVVLASWPGWWLG